MVGHFVRPPSPRPVWKMSQPSSKVYVGQLGQLAALYICLYKSFCTHVSGTGCAIVCYLTLCVCVLHTDVYVEGPAACHLVCCIVQWGVSQSSIALPHSRCPLCHLHSPTVTMLYVLCLCRLYQLWPCQTLAVQWRYCHVKEFTVFILWSLGTGCSKELDSLAVHRVCILSWQLLLPQTPHHLCVCVCVASGLREYGEWQPIVVACSHEHPDVYVWWVASCWWGTGLSQSVLWIMLGW
jgi:hypothetical protein